MEGCASSCAVHTLKNRPQAGAAAGPALEMVALEGAN